MYWQINDTDVYFYDSDYDDTAYSVVTIKDDDGMSVQNYNTEYQCWHV